MLNMVIIVIIFGMNQESPLPKGKLLKIYPPKIMKIQSNPKNLIFHEDFESGANGWTMTNGVWEIGSPSSGPDSAYQGINCAGTVLGGNYPNNTITRLISPSIVLPTLSHPDDHIILSLWHWFRTESCCDHGYIEISTDGGGGMRENCVS